MRPGKPSQTAQFVSYMRALGTLSPVVPGFTDPVAEHFVSKQFKKKFLETKRKFTTAQASSPYSFRFKWVGMFQQLRTVVIDQAIENAIDCEQFVNLASGLDDRAWRCERLRGKIAFDMDHPDTHRLKIEQGVKVPALAKEVNYISLVLGQDSLSEKLRSSQYDSKKKTFWLLEGLLPYLSPEVVKKTLQEIAAISAPGSTIALTYLVKGKGQKLAKFYIGLLGEWIRSEYLPEEFAALAASCGWRLSSDTGVKEWSDQLTPNLGVTAQAKLYRWNERVWIGTKS